MFIFKKNHNFGESELEQLMSQDCQKNKRWLYFSDVGRPPASLSSTQIGERQIFTLSEIWRASHRQANALLSRSSREKSGQGLP